MFGCYVFPYSGLLIILNSLTIRCMLVVIPMLAYWCQWSFRKYIMVLTEAFSPWHRASLQDKSRIHLIWHILVRSFLGNEAGEGPFINIKVWVFQWLGWVDSFIYQSLTTSNTWKNKQVWCISLIGCIGLTIPAHKKGLPNIFMYY